MAPTTEGRNSNPGDASVTGDSAFSNTDLEAVEVESDVAGLDQTGRVDSDSTLIEILKQDGYRGPRFDRFIDELARYSISVVRSLITSGRIFYILQSRHLRLTQVHDMTSEEISDITLETVALALRRFTVYQSSGQGWDASRRVSVKTYFIGICIIQFPNVYRRFVNQRSREKLDVLLPEMPDAPAPQAPVEDTVIEHAALVQELGSLDASSRAILVLAIQGYTHEEIAELLDVSSRSVEGRLYRLRRKLRSERRSMSDD